MENIEFYKSNIRKYYYNATETQVEAGIDWYLRANRLALKLSKRHAVDFDLVCRVIAVISPRLAWDRNVLDADVIITSWKSGKSFDDVKTFALNKNKQKAFEILDGDISRLRGPKVTRFYENIKYANTSTEVTVDIHAFRVVIDNPDLPYDTNFTRQQLADARQAYAEVAADLDLLPHQLQAVCWLVLKSVRPTWRGEKKEAVR